MKIGDLVECVCSGDWYIIPGTGDHSGVFPQHKGIYTITFTEEWNGCIFLTFKEIPDEWDAKYFRRLEFPSELEQQIAELIEQAIEA